MYTIAWTDPDGAIYRRAEQYPSDAADLIRMLAFDPDKFGLGVQYTTLDEVFALIRRMDGEIPFDGQSAGIGLSYLDGAEPDFAVAEAGEPAPFMRYPMPDVRS